MDKPLISEDTKLETLDILTQDTEDDKDEVVITDIEAGNVIKTEKDKKDEIDLDEKTDEKEEEEEVKIDDEPEESDLELVVPVRRKEILAKYPTLFKEFPYLEKAYYREQKFTEIFPTIDDAKQAQEAVGVISKYQESLFDGNVEPILGSVKQNDPEAFAKLVDNYLPNLAKVDQGAYYHILSNLVKQTVTSMVNEATRLSNEDLKTAAVILNQFVFGNSEFTPPQKLSKETGEKEHKLERERQAFHQERFNSVLSDLSSKTENTLKATIDSHIDPKQSMSDYVKRNATKDCLDQLYESINADTRFIAIRDKLWEKAAKENFSANSVDTIKKAYLSKAKTLLPELIKRTRNEALRGLNKSTTTEERKGPITPGRALSPEGKRETKDKIPPGMRTIDYFMMD